MVSGCAHCGPLLTDEEHKPDCPSRRGAAPMIAQTERPGATREGEGFISRWDRALERVASLKRELNSAECEVKNAASALGKWIAPEDAHVGETFNIWARDRHGNERMLEVEVEDVNGNGTYSIRWRGKPR